MDSLAVALALYVGSAAVSLVAALWYSRRQGEHGLLSLPVIVIIVFLGVFGWVYLLFWYLNHKPHRDALGPPPP